MLITLLFVMIICTLSIVVREYEWIDVQKDLQKLREQPFIVKHTPVPDCSIYDNLIKLLAEIDVGISESEYQLMINHESDKLWHTMHNMTSNRENRFATGSAFDVATMIDRSPECKSDFDIRITPQPTHLEPTSAPHDHIPQHVYYYYGRYVSADQVHGLYPEGERPLQPLLQLMTREASVWLASEANITASTHFDYDDNYFLQLAGSKTVTLFPPQAYVHLQPNSILHPRWRQTHVLPLSIPPFSPQQHPCSKLLLPLGEHLYRKCVDRFQHHEFQQLDWSPVTITLQAGDLLFIPSTYFHHLTTGVGSVSMSVWRSSPQSVEGEAAYATELRDYFSYLTVPVQNNDGMTCSRSPLQKTDMRRRLQLLSLFIRQLCQRMQEEADGAADVNVEGRSEVAVLDQLLIDLSLRYVNVIASLSPSPSPSLSPSTTPSTEQRSSRSWDYGLIECDINQRVLESLMLPQEPSDIDSTEEAHAVTRSVDLFAHKLLHKLDSNVGTQRLFLMDAIEELLVIAVTGSMDRKSALESDSCSGGGGDGGDGDGDTSESEKDANSLKQYLSPCALLEFVSLI